MQDDTLVLLGLCAFAVLFVGLGAAAFYFGWRFLTFRLIGGVIGKMIGGRPQDEVVETAPIMPPPHLDPQTVKDSLEFHATAARYRNQGNAPLVADDNAPADLPADTPEDNKNSFGVRYGSSSPGRVLRDKRSARVKGPDSGHDPDVYKGMFKQTGKDG